MTDYDTPDRLPPADVLHRAAMRGDEEQQRRYLDAAHADWLAACRLIAGHSGDWQLERARMMVASAEASCRLGGRVVTRRRATYVAAVDAVLDALGQVES